MWDVFVPSPWIVSTHRGRAAGHHSRGGRTRLAFRTGIRLRSSRKVSAPNGSGSHLAIVRVDQAPGPKPCHDFGQARIGDGEAALASTEHAGAAYHLLIHIPGAMHHDLDVAPEHRAHAAANWERSYLRCFLFVRERASLTQTKKQDRQEQDW